MKIEQLQELIREVPFEPFDLIMPNGERLHVPHPDFIWVFPGRHTVVAALNEDVARFVNWNMVAGIEKKTHSVA
jgi:hypothetical protein